MGGRRLLTEETKEVWLSCLMVGVLMSRVLVNSVKHLFIMVQSLQSGILTPGQ